MKVLPEHQEILQNAIRNAIAANPLVSIRRMQQIVESNTGRPIGDKYVSKLMLKIRRQAVVESDRKKMNERLAEVRERYRLLIEDLQRIICWKPEYLKAYGTQYPNFKERLAAMRLLAQLEIALFQAELQAGMFQDRQLAIEGMLRQGMLPTELHEQIVGVFRTWKVSHLTEARTTTLSHVERKNGSEGISRLWYHLAPQATTASPRDGQRRD